MDSPWEVDEGRQVETEIEGPGVHTVYLQVRIQGPLERDVKDLVTGGRLPVTRSLPLGGGAGGQENEWEVTKGPPRSDKSLDKSLSGGPSLSQAVSTSSS